MTNSLPVRTHENEQISTLDFSTGRLGAFLKALETTGNVSTACGIAKVSRTAMYQDRKRSPAFATAWTDAKQTADLRRIEAVENAAFEAATTGRRRLATHKGQPIFVWKNAAGEVVEAPSETEPIYSIDGKPIYRTHDLRREPLYEYHVSDSLAALILKSRAGYTDRSSIESHNKNENIDLAERRITIETQQRLAMEDPDFIRWKREKVVREQGQEVAVIRHWSHDIVCSSPEEKAKLIAEHDPNYTGPIE